MVRTKAVEAEVMAMMAIPMTDFGAEAALVSAAGSQSVTTAVVQSTKHCQDM